MNIKAIAGDMAHFPADAIVIGIYEGEREMVGAALAVDTALGGSLSALLRDGEASGKTGDIIVISTLGRLAVAKVALIGLGKKNELTTEKLRRAAALFSRALRKGKTRRIATQLHGAGVGGISYSTAAQVLAEGSIMGLYSYRRHVSKPPEGPEVEELTVVEGIPEHLAEIVRGLDDGRILAEAVNLARDMVNEPSNFMTPLIMAEKAREVALKYGLECNVIEREHMVEMGMGALTGVAQGSAQPPKLIVLSYRGNPESKTAMAWVGKAITFDSGGISLKPPDGMELMKGDMAGGAAVIGALAAVAQLKPKVNITGLIPATENMPSGRALKPGDVVKAMNGKTIEIISTDAEGRLVLSDALCFAVKEGLSPLVDLATLTGACHIALGDVCSGAFSNRQDWLDIVVKAGDAAGECLWPMPSLGDYKELIKSTVADIKNTGGRWGGAIAGALFLAEFVGDVPWVHLDIAGTAQLSQERGYLVKGATGVGVRTLVNLSLMMTNHMKKN